MNDKPRIIFGLAIFIVLATFPIWYTLGLAAYGAGSTAAPDRLYPSEVPRCIEERQWMAANHMKLLYGWRDEVVRQGDTKLYQSQDFGTKHVKSLTQTCLECHSKPEMCDASGNTSCTQCHDYANVQPRCWNCHVELRGK